MYAKHYFYFSIPKWVSATEKFSEWVLDFRYQNMRLSLDLMRLN